MLNISSYSDLNLFWNAKSSEILTLTTDESPNFKVCSEVRSADLPISFYYKNNGP
jgi:hypothetical protein